MVAHQGKYIIGKNDLQISCHFTCFYIYLFIAGIQKKNKRKFIRPRSFLERERRGQKERRGQAKIYYINYNN
jgi:hypothetical protein